MNKYLVGENELLFPKVDFLFTQIFGSEESSDLLCSLISAILKVPEESLKDITVLNPKLSKDFADDRTGVLDIKAEVNGEQINIEMQLVPHKAMAERVLFYWAKIFTEPFEPSMKFHELKRTVSIIICDEDFLPIEKYHSKFQRRCVRCYLNKALQCTKPLTCRNDTASGERLVMPIHEGLSRWGTKTPAYISPARTGWLRFSAIWHKQGIPLNKFPPRRGSPLMMF